MEAELGTEMQLKENGEQLLLPKRPFGGGEIELIYDPANFSSPLNIHDQYLRT